MALGQAKPSKFLFLSCLPADYHRLTAEFDDYLSLGGSSELLDLFMAYQFLVELLKLPARETEKFSKQASAIQQ